LSSEIINSPLPFPLPLPLPFPLRLKIVKSIKNVQEKNGQIDCFHESYYVFGNQKLAMGLID